MDSNTKTGCLAGCLLSVAIFAAAVLAVVTFFALAVGSCASRAPWEEADAALQANSGIAKLVSAMQAAGLKENRIRTILAKTLKTLGKGGRDLNAALTESAKTTTKAAIRVIVQIVLFLIIVLLVSVLLQILVNGTRGLIWKVDVLKFLDKFLGFLLGAILMLAVILIVFYICGRLHWSTFETAVDQTLFSAFLQENNPLRLFLE